jgi:hypothetical protein
MWKADQGTREFKHECKASLLNIFKGERTLDEPYGHRTKKVCLWSFVLCMWELSATSLPSFFRMPYL